LLTNGQGYPVRQGTFLPFGEEYNPQVTNNHYKFTGKERDTESSLDYFGERYYSNGVGRFITPDWAAKATAVPYAELVDPQSLNLYSYVRNRPTVMVDADGHYLLGAISAQNEAEYEEGVYGSGKKQQSDQQNQENTQNSVKQPGFLRKLGQRFSNLIHHKGFRTDEELAPKGTVETSEIITGVHEPNPAITAATDAAGLLGIVAPETSKKVGLGYVGAIASSYNDPTASNITFNVLGLIDGFDGPLAITSAFNDFFDYGAHNSNGRVGDKSDVQPTTIYDDQGNSMPNPDLDPCAGMYPPVKSTPQQQGENFQTHPKKKCC
jgi:RHS repeat-associated protein